MAKCDKASLIYLAEKKDLYVLYMFTENIPLSVNQNT